MSDSPFNIVLQQDDTKSNHELAAIFAKVRDEEQRQLDAKLAAAAAAEAEMREFASRLSTSAHNNPTPEN